MQVSYNKLVYSKLMNRKDQEECGDSCKKSYPGVEREPFTNK